MIPAKVAREVRAMLAAGGGEEGTGTKAQIPGYEVAGKTGTAEKPLPDGSGYSEVRYVASFVGMVPGRPPAARRARGRRRAASAIYGGDVAAPAVQQIMRFALQHLEIAP